MLLKRSYTPELMDDFSILDERVDQALIELKIINKFLGGNATSKMGFAELLEKIPKNSCVNILDAGSGASDIILSIREDYSNLNIYGLDLNYRACIYAKNNSPDVRMICGNVLNAPFKNAKFDLAHASLFLHHFKEEDIKIIIVKLLDSARYGLIINDLRRSIPAYWGIKILTFLFSQSKLVKNDAPVSVRRGFIKPELKKILNELNIKNYQIKRTHMFRWLIVIFK